MILNFDDIGEKMAEIKRHLNKPEELVPPAPEHNKSIDDEARDELNDPRNQEQAEDAQFITKCYKYLKKLGYTQTSRPHDSEQFDVSDQRTLDEVVCWLLKMGYIPSFCTACYRAGRTGDRFMALCKSRQILNCCHPNALMTLKEFLLDYGSPGT